MPSRRPRSNGADERARLSSPAADDVALSAAVAPNLAPVRTHRPTPPLTTPFNGAAPPVNGTSAPAARNLPPRAPRAAPAAPHPRSVSPPAGPTSPPGAHTSAALSPRSGSTRLRHWASLIVAEHPLQEHREYIHRLQSAGSPPAVSPRRRGRSSPPPSKRDNPTFDETLNGTPDQTHPGAAPPLAEPADDAEAFAAARAAAKSGRLYRLVRSQILLNKKRRGRAQYVLCLKQLYRSIVPAHGASAPERLDALETVYCYGYIACITAFDAVTPSSVGSHAALIIAALVSMAAMATLAMAGLYLPWLLGTALGADVAAADADAAWEADAGVGAWGPALLWDQRIGNNTAFPDQYAAAWGATGRAVVAATGEGWRYFGAVFLHRSFWHFACLATALMLSGANIERKYGSGRTLVMAAAFTIAGSCFGMLAAQDCELIMGLGPLAWGFLLWWVSDLVAVMSFWPWGDTRKVVDRACSRRNAATFVCLTATALLLLIAEIVLRQSNAAASIGGLLCGFHFAPMLAPRWRTSAMEALTTLSALLGAFVLLLVFPLAAVGRVAALDSASAGCAYVVQV